MLEVAHVAPDGAQHWLATRVHILKRDDELAPVTVICSSRASALGNRRALARSGSVNTRFAVLSELSEALAAPLLARRSLSPLTAVVKQALLRRVLAGPAAGLLRTNTPHPSTVEALASVIREFRMRFGADLDGPALTQTLTERGAVPAAFAGILTEYEGLLGSLGLFDDRDRIEAARDAVEMGANLHDTGAVIVHLPLAMSPGEVSLIRAIGTRTPTVVSLPAMDGESEYLMPAEALAAVEALEGGTRPGNGSRATAASAIHRSRESVSPAVHQSQGTVPPVIHQSRETVSPAISHSQETESPAFGVVTSLVPGLVAGQAGIAELHITAAPSAGEEVRAAVRCVLAEHESGVPLYEIAILHNDDATYGRLLADVLGSAAVPFTVVGGRALSDSWAVRGLLGLLRLRDSDFSRVSVLAWLSGFPWIQAGVPQPATWERLSREAGVVRGVDGWTAGLNRLAAAYRAADIHNDPDVDIDPEVVSYRERIARSADAIAAYVIRLERETVPPAESTWSAFSTWAIALFRNHVLRSSWTGPEAEAGQLVIEILRSLPSAAAASAGSRPLPCTLTVLIETLDGLFAMLAGSPWGNLAGAS